MTEEQMAKVAELAKKHGVDIAITGSHAETVASYLNRFKLPSWFWRAKKAESALIEEFRVTGKLITRDLDLAHDLPLAVKRELAEIFGISVENVDVYKKIEGPAILNFLKDGFAYQNHTLVGIPMKPGTIEWNEKWNLTPKVKAALLRLQELGVSVGTRNSPKRMNYELRIPMDLRANEATFVEIGYLLAQLGDEEFPADFCWPRGFSGVPSQAFPGPGARESVLRFDVDPAFLYFRLSLKADRTP
jgi:hypothetical protein